MKKFKPFFYSCLVFCFANPEYFTAILWGGEESVTIKPGPFTPPPPPSAVVESGGGSLEVVDQACCGVWPSGPLPRALKPPSSPPVRVLGRPPRPSRARRGPRPGGPGAESSGPSRSRCRDASALHHGPLGDCRGGVFMLWLRTILKCLDVYLLVLSSSPVAVSL